MNLHDWMNVKRQDALGFCSMPDGYELWRLDSGHWMWAHPSTDRESVIHWDRWAIYHGAVVDSKTKQAIKELIQ